MNLSGNYSRKVNIAKPIKLISNYKKEGGLNRNMGIINIPIFLILESII